VLKLIVLTAQIPTGKSIQIYCQTIFLQMTVSFFYNDKMWTKRTEWYHR